MGSFVVYLETPAGVRLSYVADAYDGYAACAVAASRMRIHELRALSSVRFAEFGLMTSAKPEEVIDIVMKG